MVWARLDDEILDNPKIVRVGPIGFALHVAAITWCSRNLTDGFIPEHKARTILPLRWAGESKASPEASENLRQVRWTLSMTSGMAGYEGEDIIDSTLALLVESGLWVEDFDNRGNLGYRIHDYDKYNPSREQVLRERAEGRERAKKSKASREASPSLRPKLRRGFGVSSDRPVPDPVPKREEREAAGAAPPPDLEQVVSGNAVNDQRELEKPRKAKHRYPESEVPAGDASAEDVAAWCARWKLPAPSEPRVQLFLDVHRKKGSRWRDWSAAWRTFESNERRWGGPRGAPDVDRRPGEPAPAPYHREWRPPEELEAPVRGDEARRLGDGLLALLDGPAASGGRR